MVNSADPDQTALIWVCLVCLDVSMPIHRTITVHSNVLGFIRYSLLNCLSIGIPKTINFLFVPNGNLLLFTCPNIFPKTMSFPFVSKWKIIAF